MIICKRLAPLDDYLQEADINNKRGDRVDRTVGGEEGKGEEGERGEEGAEQGGEESLAHGRADRPIKGSTRGPRRPKKLMTRGSLLFFCAIFIAHPPHEFKVYSSTRAHNCRTLGS